MIQNSIGYFIWLFNVKCHVKPSTVQFSVANLFCIQTEPVGADSGLAGAEACQSRVSTLVVSRSD